MKIFAFTLSLFSLSIVTRTEAGCNGSHCARPAAPQGAAASSAGSSSSAPASEAKPAGAAPQASAVVDSRNALPAGVSFSRTIEDAAGQIDVVKDAKGTERKIRRLVVSNGIATVEPLNNRDFDEVMPVPPLRDGQSIESAVFKLDRFNQVEMIEVTLNDGSKMAYKPGSPQRVRITKADGSSEEKFLTPQVASTAPDVRRGANGESIIRPQGLPAEGAGRPEVYINAEGRRVVRVGGN